MRHRKPVLGRVWPMARERKLTPAIQVMILLWWLLLKTTFRIPSQIQYGSRLVSPNALLRLPGRQIHSFHFSKVKERERKRVFSLKPSWICSFSYVRRYAVDRLRVVSSNFVKRKLTSLLLIVPSHPAPRGRFVTAPSGLFPGFSSIQQI